MASTKKIKVDGLGPDDLQKVRVAIRKVWSWSHPRRLALKRATQPDGFLKCEKCGAHPLPRGFVDHIEPLGALKGEFLHRLYCPSGGLQVLCSKCHGAKTREEELARRLGLE